VRRRAVATFAALVLLAGGGAWCALHRPVPGGPPWYVGRIDTEKTYGGTFLLVPNGGTFGKSVSIYLHPHAVVERRDGAPATLATGQVVSVWCSGPVAESMPPKVGADLIVIESDAP
jgi:hypothetical protein